MIPKSWIWYEYFGSDDKPTIDGNGSFSSLDEETCVIQVKRAFGFHREDWGEGNWTADDLR